VRDPAPGSIDLEPMVNARLRLDEEQGKASRRAVQVAPAICFDARFCNSFTIFASTRSDISAAAARIAAVGSA
jgi:hypothetical protein